MATFEARAYGAVGDGVTDDTAAFQRAVDARAASHYPMAETKTLTGPIDAGMRLRVRFTHLPETEPIQAPDDTPAEPADDPVPEPKPETDPEVEP